MKLWHLLLAIVGTAIVLAIARDPIGRVALIVFTTALGLMILGVSSLLMLFRTVGAIGMARSLWHYVEATFATAGVLFFGTAAMLAVLWCGMSMLALAVG